MRSTAALAAFTAALAVVGALAGRKGRQPERFLIASAPRDSKVGYLRIHPGGVRGGEAMRDLITSGLVSPQGIAHDQARRLLFIADPGARRVFAYDLVAAADRLTAKNRRIAADNTESRWVGVDAVGNVFISNEPENQILRLTAAQLSHGDTTPEVVYSGASLAQVSAPGGIAIDNLHAYWVNKQVGTQVGSVMRGAGSGASTNRGLALLGGGAGAGTGVRSLASNTDKSYGVCLGSGNVFYTQPQNVIFGVKARGSAAPVALTDRLASPRGCAYDGDGTVYVADRGANAIYSFAGNMADLSTVQLTKAADYEDAFGVTVFTSRASLALPAVAMGLALAARAL